MPEFGTPFSGLASERKLGREELIRALRYSIAAEYEAVQLYMQLAESVDDALAKTVLKEVADEERVHAGEFLRLLRYLAPDEERLYAQGAKEVEEMMQKLGKGREQGERREEAEPKNNGLPYCTVAAAAEQARGYREEEPCDDARAVKIEEE